MKAAAQQVPLPMMARFIKFLRTASTCALVLLAASTCGAQNPVLNALPQTHQSAPYRWFASTDAQHKNNDFVLLKPNETRRIKLSAGKLERLWMTASEPDKLRVELSSTFVGSTPKSTFVSRILLDNNRAVDGEFKDKAFTFYPSNFYLFSNPTLVATNKSDKSNKWFYQVSVRPNTAKIAPQVLAGQTKIVRVQQLLKDGDSLGAFDVSGGFARGQIETLKITLKPATVKDWNRVFLRGFPTGKAEKGPGSLSDVEAPTSDNPQFAIDTPLNALSGQFFDVIKKSDAVSDFDGQTLTLHWPMPFDTQRGDVPVFDLFNGASERVTITLEATVRELKSTPPTIFHAQYGSDKTERNTPISIADIQGSGAFVGLALAIKPDTNSSRRAFAYLEGNEKIHADNRVYEGTGTEDYFNSAWYFPDKPFVQDFGGLTWKQALPPQVSMFRWQVLDAIPFSNSLKFDFEHGNGNNSDDLEWRWLACWYQKPGGKWVVNDELHDVPGSDAPDSAQMKAQDEKRDAVFRRYMLASTVGVLGIGAIIGLFSWLRRAKK